MTGESADDASHGVGMLSLAILLEMFRVATEKIESMIYPSIVVSVVLPTLDDPTESERLEIIDETNFDS